MNLDKASDFPSGFAFRLIYNGKVLTSSMDGCAAGSELCDSQVLIKQVMPFAKYLERDCTSTASATPPASGAYDLRTDMEKAPETLVDARLVVALVIISMVLSNMVTFFLMRRQVQGHQYHRGS